jgi:hypothetical protein
MTKQTYGLDVSKIKTLKDVRNVFGEMKLVGYFDPEDTEDEYYNLREYFTILQKPQELTFPPAPRKSIDEISQELDEKIDALIKTTKEKFECSNYFAGKRYNQKFDRIIQDFEYAKEHGQFPLKLTLGSEFTVKSSYPASGCQTSFVIKQGNKHEGYYTIGNQRFLKYYMNEKPNAVVRFFMDKLLGFKWVDETT